MSFSQTDCETLEYCIVMFSIVSFCGPLSFSKVNKIGRVYGSLIILHTMKRKFQCLEMHLMLYEIFHFSKLQRVGCVNCIEGSFFVS